MTVLRWWPAVFVLVLAGCGGDPPPTAADGTNLAACADGNCEVRVTANAKISPPPSTLIESLTVVSVAEDKVTLSGRDIGNNHSGGCYQNCHGSSNNNDFTIVFDGPGSGRQNKLDISVTSVDGDSAILKLQA